MSTTTYTTPTGSYTTTTTIQGQNIPTTTNYPPSQHPPIGTKYQTDIRFTVPLLNYIDDFALVVNQLVTNFIAEVTGHGSTATDVNFSTPDAYTVRMTSTMTSLDPATATLITVVVIIGVLSVLAYFTYSAVTTLTIPNPTTGQSTLDQWLGGIGNNIIIYVLIFGVAVVGIIYLLMRIQRKSTAPAKPPNF